MEYLMPLRANKDKELSIGTVGENWIIYILEEKFNENKMLKM